MIKNFVKSKDWIVNSPRRVMVGMHVPDYDQIPDEYCLKLPGIYSQVDPEKIISRLKEAKVQVFWFYSKCHMGNAYYPSKIGHVHSALNGRDLFGEFVDECLKAGIIPAAVYEVSDRRIPVDKPEWCHRIKDEFSIRDVDLTDARQGASLSGPCINGPYGDFVIEQSLELARNYPIKGIYFDFLGLFTFGRWICPYCNRKFKHEFGIEFKGLDTLSHKQYVDYVRWHYAENDKYAKKLRNAIRTIRPDIVFTHNFHGNSNSVNLQRAEFAAENCDFVTGDIFQHRAGMLQLSWKFRQYASLSEGVPGESLLDGPVSIKNDFVTLKALDSYRAELWTARASNIAVCLSFILSMDGSASGKSFGLIEKVFKEQEQYEPWLHNMQIIAEVGIIRSHDTIEFAPAVPESRIMESHHAIDFEGWCQMLIAGHCLWDVISQHQITEEWLSKYKVVILPNVSCLSRKECSAIISYVKNGGVLIADGNTSLCDESGNLLDNFALAEIFGADYTGNLNSKFQLLKLDSPEFIFNCPWREDLLFFNNGQFEVRAKKSAEILGSIYGKSRIGICNEMLPEGKTGFLKNNCGSGTVYYFSGQPGLQYRIFGQNAMKELAVSLLRKARGNSMIELDAPDTVELFIHRQDEKNNLVINLVNAVSGGSRSSGVASWQIQNQEDCLMRFGEFEKMPPAGDVTIKLNNPKIKRAYLAPDYQQVEMKLGADNTVEFEIKDLTVYKMLVIEMLA